MAKNEIEAIEITSGSKKEIKTADCGLIMPISNLDGCPAEHWAEVKNIISGAIDSIENPKFSVKLVSDADDIGIIQKRIIQNIYTSDLVVCDVSGKNPNVMFELGMRLAFDKPVVIVKDDKTDYSFDTGIIEHITYPRDLRFTRIVEFKKTLATKIIGTYNVAVSTPDQSPFLKNFGRFTVANLDETTVSSDRLLIELIEELRMDVRRLQRKIDSPSLSSRRRFSTAEFINRAIPVISSYIKEEKIPDTQVLIGDGRFYKSMEEALSAPEHFSSPKEFTETLDMLLNSYPFCA